VTDVQAPGGDEQADRERSWDARLRSHIRGGRTFFLLFFLLLASLALLIGGTEARWSRLGGEVLTGGALLLAVLAAQASHTWRLLGWVALAGAVCSAIAGEFLNVPAVSGLVGLLFTVLLVASVPLVLGRIARHEEVTWETVVGALCVYLLLGMAFANLNLVLSFLQQSAVLVSSIDPYQTLARGNFYYFSFINMATVGFGDIVPATNLARTLAVFQAVLGQLFLVTIVARLVSVATVRRREKPQPQTQAAEATNPEPSREESIRTGE